MKPIKLKELSAGLKAQVGNLAGSGFKQIYGHIDPETIKKGVDKLGLDKFIEQCAILAAGSGAIAGSGGIVTLIVGTPLDMANLITQQFRTTIAIMYANQGTYKFGFEEFMGMVATSFKVEAGMALSKTMMENIAEKILLMIGTRTAERLVPIVGGVIGGATNYMFIKRVAKKVKEAQTTVLVMD